AVSAPQTLATCLALRIARTRSVAPAALHIPGQRSQPILLLTRPRPPDEATATVATTAPGGRSRPCEPDLESPHATPPGSAGALAAATFLQIRRNSFDLVIK